MPVFSTLPSTALIALSSLGACLSQSLPNPPTGVLQGQQGVGEESEDEETAQLVGCRAQVWVRGAGGGPILDPPCPLNVSPLPVFPGPRGHLQGGGRAEEGGNLSRQSRKGTVWECIKDSIL